MNIRKFIAPTARQALRDIRNELGDEAVILSNRNVDEGVEIIALANDEVTRLTDSATAQKAEVLPRGVPVGKLAGRENLSEPLLLRSDSSADRRKKTEDESKSSLAPQSSENNILVELKSMQSILQQQLAALSWSGVQQHDPQRAGLLRRMLNSGFSALLTRQLLDKMPAGSAQGESWVKQVLKRNLLVAGEADDIVAKGGVYALIGPTGVGKTTTTAKLAARAVVRYGADKVALLTTDSYRIGAYEQLKIYGKILGVAVHAVKDADDLRLTLSALRHKHLVLIDTVGMGQRDERVGDQNEMFEMAGVQSLLLLNAASSGDTLEDVVRMYHNNKVVGCITTKLDEAVNPGAVLDVAVRHRLVMHYMANGQRVPEDLHPVSLDYMLHRAFKAAEEKTPFTLHELDFPVLMAAEGSVRSSGAPTGGVNSASSLLDSGLPTFGVLLAGAAEGASHMPVMSTPDMEASYAP